MIATINGEAVELTQPSRNLADLLRDDLGLKGTRVGCGEGVCGSCTVLVDGQSLRACLTLAAQVEGASVTTVEGFAQDPEGRAIQQAFADNFAAQCGFCTAGMMAVVREYLADASVPDHADPAAIRARINAVVCRCTGYQAIVTAVQAAVRAR